MTLLDGLQNRHLACKKYCSNNPQRRLVGYLARLRAAPKNWAVQTNTPWSSSCNLCRHALTSQSPQTPLHVAAVVLASQGSVRVRYHSQQYSPDSRPASFDTPLCCCTVPTDRRPHCHSHLSKINAYISHRKSCVSEWVGSNVPINTL